MPKVSIPIKNFIEQDIYTQKYNVRYRILSDNQNNFSYWSPIFEVDPEFIFVQGSFDLPGNFIIEKHTGYVALVWDSVGIYKNINSVNTLIAALNDYDLWVQYSENGGANPSNWIYKERVSTNSTNENTPATYTDSGGTPGRTTRWMRAEIYRPGRPISRYNDLTISITQSGTTVDVANDTIITPSAHGLETGDAIIYEASSAIGGLTTDTAYWIRVVNSTTFSLHSYKSQAINNTNKVPISSTGSGTGTFKRYPFLLYKNIITTL